MQGSGQNSGVLLATTLSRESGLPEGMGGTLSSSMRPSSPAWPKLGGIVLLRRTGAGRPPGCWGPTRLCRFRRFTGNTEVWRRGRGGVHIILTCTKSWGV